MTIDTHPTLAHQCATMIREQHPHFHPKVGIVLGSGLGNLVSHLEERITISYADLPGFPHTTVHGHEGQFNLGYLSGVPVICLQGRAHAYEGDSFEGVKTYVRTLKLLGCDYFIATNASGSMHETMAPGELMLISDHINLQPTNPLVGPNDDRFGPRFLPVDSAYDAGMREQFLTIATRHGTRLHEGVYVAVLGPNYETAAEIRAFRTLGGDAVGMSTVPEVLVAHHCGLKVAAIATLTNYATGLAKTAHDHQAVVATAAQATEKLGRLIMDWVRLL